MDKNRSQFIQQLVSALQARDDISSSSSASANCVDGELISDNNQEIDKLLREDERQFLSVSISATERIQLAQEAYMQLQFDYPQTQASSIEALAELYRRISTEKLTDIAAQIPITTSLLDGVAYLNNQISSSSSSSKAPTSRCSESSGLLAASILILLFRLCLEMPGDTRVDKLLSSLVVKQPLQSKDHDVRSHEFKLLQEENDPLVEIYASEEDPDDLSDVYEGQLLELPYHTVAYLHHPVSSQSFFSHTEKLQLIASCTFSSSFQSISIEKWEQWHLNDALFAILRRLLATSPPQDTDSERTGPLIPFYGVQGEWKRYLYVLRDRVLRFSQCSQRTIWQFKDLIDFYQKRESAAFAIDEPMCSTQWMPQHFVFSVLAELAVSQEFNCKGTQQMQQNWSLVFQALVPNIMQEIHRILSRSSANVKAAIVETIHDDEEDEIRVVYLHLLHFMIVASSNVHKTIELLFASGMLQILLKLLPSFDIDMTQQCNTKRWFRALLRFVGECALWHASFAVYLSQIPKFFKLLPTLRGQLDAEELLFALAFNQHNVNLLQIDVWATFESHCYIPRHCESYFHAMAKLRDVLFVVNCLEKSFTALRPAVQRELKRSVQHINANFTSLFEYPIGTNVEDCKQQQDSALLDEHKKEDRDRLEAMQFTTLRNKLRQSLKSILAASASSSILVGSSSSKLD